MVLEVRAGAFRYSGVSMMLVIMVRHGFSVIFVANNFIVSSLASLFFCRDSIGSSLVGSSLVGRSLVGSSRVGSSLGGSSC